MEVAKQETSAPKRNSELDGLYGAISGIIESSRRYAKAAIDYAMVYANYEIGRLIVEDEQGGAARAAYGAKLLPKLSERLTAQYGKGYSVENLRLMRRFFLTYPQRQISQTLSTELPDAQISQKASGEFEMVKPGEFSMIEEATSHQSNKDGRFFCLSWSHYVFLMRIDNKDERAFYETEAAKNGWSLKELKRQFNSALYERLALSRNKEKVELLSTKGQLMESPLDAVKDPYVLEFLGLPEKATYSESELESRIISHLQEFLLELGAGFAFVGRQVRIAYDEEHFFIDLVFYNRLLRCFVLFDLKIGELKHQDLGQMQMYVHYYDRKVKLEDENPTVGIVLCKDKNDSVVEMTLPEDNQQIFASKYLTVLPSKEDLRRLLDETDEQVSDEAVS